MAGGRTATGAIDHRNLDRSRALLMCRRTRIVATLGPATDPADVLAGCSAGVDVARINFSHGSADEHLARIARFREAAAASASSPPCSPTCPGRSCGPHSRPRGPSRPATTSPSAPPPSRSGPGDCPDRAGGAADVRPGQRMLLDDGRMQLEASDAAAGSTARVMVGGTLSPNKGLNLPDTPLTIPAVTERDRAALAVAAGRGVDWVALSFVAQAGGGRRVAARRPARSARRAGAREDRAAGGGRRAAAIVAAFDGVMVARGDLGVEIPLERVPTVQKLLIAEARAAGKPVITATDMLDSMRRTRGRPGPRPATWPTPSSTGPTRSCSPARRRSGSTRSRRSAACTGSRSRPRRTSGRDRPPANPPWARPSTTTSANWPCAGPRVKPTRSSCRRCPDGPRG